MPPGNAAGPSVGALEPGKKHNREGGAGLSIAEPAPEGSSLDLVAQLHDELDAELRDAVYVVRHVEDVPALRAAGLSACHVADVDELDEQLGRARVAVVVDPVDSQAADYIAATHAHVEVRQVGLPPACGSIGAMLGVRATEIGARPAWDADQAAVAATVWLDWVATHATTERAAQANEPAALAPRVWRVMDAEDVALIEPPDYIIDGWLQERTLALLAAEPTAGKSLLALDWSLRIRHGLEWRGREVKPGSVLYLAGEGFAGQGSRLRAWRAQNDAGATPHRLRFVDGVPCLSTATGQQQLDAELVRFAEEVGEVPRLVVVDTLSQAFGDGDENDTRTVAPCLRALSDMRTRHGCSVLLLHHLTKAPADGPRRLTLRAVRGSGAFVANVDAVLGIESGEVRRLISLKLKDGEEPQPDAFQVVGVETGRVLRNGRPERAPLCMPAGESAQGQRDESAARQGEIRRVLRSVGGEGMTRRELSSITGVSPTTLLADLSAMREVRQAKQGNAWRYFTSDFAPSVATSVGGLSADESPDRAAGRDLSAARIPKDAAAADRSKRSDGRSKPGAA